MESRKLEFIKKIGMKGCNSKIYWRVMQILCLLFFWLLIIYMFNCKIYGNYLLLTALANIGSGRKNEDISEDVVLEYQEWNS